MKSFSFTILGSILIGIIFLLQGCLARTIVKKAEDEEHIKQDSLIINSILKTAKPGDWLVIRGYHVSDNIVSNATGVPLSHVGILDYNNKEVIEAEGKGIHISTLKDFVNKSYRLLIIRLRWHNDSTGNIAVENAKQLIGKTYDFTGTIGINSSNKYYCTELALFIYSSWFNEKEKFPKVIKPGELYLYGTILYDSKPRDEF